MIYDGTRDVPYLITDDCAIIGPEPTYAAAEVKGNPTFYRQFYKDEAMSIEYPLGHQGRRYRRAGALVSAFENIKSISDACGSPIPGAFTGVFSFGINFNYMDLYDAFDNIELQHQLGLKHVDELPLHVCVPGSLFISGLDMCETGPHHGTRQMGAGLWRVQAFKIGEESVYLSQDVIS